MFRRRTTLGLAVTSHSITVVEVAATNGGGRASRAAVLAVPEGAGLGDPVSLGKALKQFLRSNGFSASRCVIGIEASRLTAREKTLPPAAVASAANILSLMVEREFGSDRKELVFDYSLGTRDAGESSALLVAAPQSVLDQLTAMAGAAGLNLISVTPSTMALAGATNGDADRDQIILHVFGGGAELVLRARGGIEMMRRLPIRIPAGDGLDRLWGNGRMLSELADELRCVVSLLPGAGDDTARELLIWDETGLKPADCDVLSEYLALPVRTCECPDGLELGSARPAPGAQFFAAATMALAAVCARALRIDLLHSRLSPPKRIGIGRWAAWVAIVVAAIAVAVTVLALDWRRDRLEVAALTTRLEDMHDDLAEAEDVIDKVIFARPWYDRRPSYLDCMREVTLAFPQEGLIWTTSLAVQQDMHEGRPVRKVVLSGKAIDESAVLDVLDRLKANPRLSEVKPLYLRQVVRQGRQVAFAITFTFIQSGKRWFLPNAKKSLSQRR